jgi:hypothetical protein
MTAEDLISGALAKPAFAPAGAAAIAVTVFIHEIRVRSGQNGGIRVRYAVATSIGPAPVALVANDRLQPSW